MKVSQNVLNKYTNIAVFREQHFSDVKRFTRRIVCEHAHFLRTRMPCRIFLVWLEYEGFVSETLNICHDHVHCSSSHPIVCV